MSNSLSAVHPELVAEWSDRNLPLTPDSITFGSNKKVWWKGACGHEWETSVKARSNGEKCPICSGARVVTGITKINYPVMQSKDNPNFYLRHGFDKSYTVYGCPYVQENCDVDAPSDNLVIYGHHMNDNSMFAGLMKYADKSFWEKHKIIQFDTLTEKGKYEVVAAFKTEVYTDSPNSFRYYDFVNADTEDDFDAYIAKCKELAIYDTGVNAEYGDKLITLSTCEYSHNNGRMVVVAKKVAE